MHFKLSHGFKVLAESYKDEGENLRVLMLQLCLGPGVLGVATLQQPNGKKCRGELLYGRGWESPFVASELVLNQSLDPSRSALPKAVGIGSPEVSL